MKIFAVLFLAIIVFPIGFISCSGPDMSKELATIDSLSGKIRDAKKEFMSIDTLRINEISQTAEKNITAIKNMFQPGDTLTMEIGQRVTSYKGFRKAGMKMNGMRKTLRDEFALTENQLKLLKDDIHHNALNADTVKVYLKAETEATMKLLSSYEVYKKMNEQAIKDFDSLNPVIENMIREHELKKMEQKPK